MATPKRITKEQAEANKKKQQVLKDAGYRIKVDGSWGPWQEKEYRKVISKENTNKANVGVMALPMAGYGAAQLFGGSIALPSLSSFASSLFPAASAALTLAGPAMGAYELYRGVYPKVQETPQERQERVYAPDATRTSRPIISEFPIEGNYLRPGIIGERYINPVLTRAASRSRQLATDTTATASGDSTQAFLEELVQATSRNTTAASPSQEPENNEDKKKDKKGNSNSWFKLWEGSGTSNNPNFWRHVRNYGIRVPLYTGAAASAFDIVGNIIGASREPEGQKHQWVWPLTSNRFILGKGILDLVGDAYSTPTDSMRRDSSQVSYPTDSQQIQQPQPVFPQVKGDTIEKENLQAIIDSLSRR